MECNFFESTNFQLFFLPNFQGLIRIKIWLIDVKSIDVAHLIWLSGCPKISPFRAKNALKLEFLKKLFHPHEN
jgi:hypothetical protein